jgi:peptide/nickel transport system permease protein
MLGYLVRRFPSLLAMFAASTVVAFALPRLAPGDPAVTAAGPDAPPEVIAAIRTDMGLDRPLAQQYWQWLTGLFRGDLGTSYTTGRPVSELIADRLPSTIELAIAAGLLFVVIGFALGIVTSTSRSPAVRAVLDGVNSVLLAAPPFLTGLLLILLLGIVFPVLPASGEVSVLDDPNFGIQYLILPATALALPQAATLARLLDTSMSATRREDFIDLAHAKGLRPGRIVRRHILRNSLGPPLVIIGLRLGELLAGAIVVEAIFGRHGLGSLAVSSVQSRDYFVIQILIVAAVLIATILQMATEVGAAALDPRVRLGAKQ